MNKEQSCSYALAAAITKKASKQTYYTIRYFVDRHLVADAYRAYGYFRWLDDILDAQDNSEPWLMDGGARDKMAFIHRQRALLEGCYHGVPPQNLLQEEHMLVDLVRNDSGKNPGLRSYLFNMMAVMEFDARRRGRMITQAALTEYSRLLSTAVTDAMYYFIGHDDPPPRHHGRYLAVTAAHITHMLRDAIEDIEAGYINISSEYLKAQGISPDDVDADGYREWVRGRVARARRCFAAGRESLAMVKNLRCRLAGYAYAARFEWVLRSIERDHYHLRSDYSERKSLHAGLWMLSNTLVSMVASLWLKKKPRTPAFRSMKVNEL